MKKKLIAFCLVVLIVMSLVPTVALADKGAKAEHSHRWEGLLGVEYSNRIIVKTNDSNMGLVDHHQNEYALNKNLGPNDKWSFTAVPTDTSKYEFVRWEFKNSSYVNNLSTNGDKLSFSYKYEPALAFNAFVATAVFREKPKYTVTFAAGDHGSLSGITSYTLYSGSDFPTAPTVSEDYGWEFNGWSPSLPNTVTETQTYTAQYKRKNYDITFNVGSHGTWSDGSSEDKTVRTAYESVPDAPAITPNKGWRMKGWSPALSKATKDASYTAQYEREIYTIAFRVGDNGTWEDGTTADKVSSLEYEAEVSAPSVKPDRGYRFIGWDKDVVTSAQGSETYTAQYKAIDYTLTIQYLNRETGNEIAPTYEETYHYQDAYSVASPAVSGYDVPSFATVSGSMPADDKLVIVYYDAHDFAMQYVSNATDTPTDLRTYSVFHRDSSSFSYPVKLGYKLSDSAPITEIGNIGFSNTAASPLVFTTAAIGTDSIETCRLYWYDADNDEWVFARGITSAPLHQLTFLAGSGRFADGAAERYVDVYASQTPALPGTPSLAGHTFAGWDINDDGILDAADDTNGDGSYTGADILSLNVTESLTISAIYQINTYKMTTSVTNGIVSGSVSGNYGSDVTVTYSPAAGHHLASLVIDGVPVTDLTPYQSSYTFKNIISDHTIDVIFAINTYTVRFVDFNGNTISTQTVNWNTGATAPASPSRAGYRFIGWDSNFGAVTADMTVTALYQRNTVATAATTALEGEAVANAPNDETEPTQSAASLPEEQIPFTADTDTETIPDEPIPEQGQPGVFAWWWILVAVAVAGVIFLFIIFKRRKEIKAESE